MEEYFEASLFSRPFLSAVIVAAGSSVRMGGEDKIFLPISGVPVIARSMLAYENCEDVSEIVVVTKESSIDAIKSAAEKYGITKLKTVVTVRFIKSAPLMLSTSPRTDLWSLGISFPRTAASI